ncbi:sensor histidine kinase [Clostridium beijerinckii]|uniref:Sensor histidine kinase YpdA n=1 Tax=Clostridium beijerinckii TaxID=1520 RepID=A0A1S8SCW0_CLOBE|nr:sensor histidine kinase [Clostridium beijerinckii]NRY60244.1 two-component system sensor histidine kinase YesM [Clostridium beijerinckii]OOM63440.1 sensor histidine kinase YpdA [Clostridium beijerinckii]
MKRFLPKTIKARITIVIMFSTIITTILISYFCFSTFQNLLRKNLIQSTGSNLQLVMKNIENNMDNIENLAKWCTTNSTISSYVVNAPNRISGREAINTYYRLQEELLNSRSSNHVGRLIISNPRNALLQTIYGMNDGLLSDGKTSREVPYFQELIQAKDFKWIGLKQDPFNNKIDSYVIPIIRPIYSTFDSTIDGWIYISVNSSIITDYLEDYKIEDGSDLYIIINNTIYLYKDKKLKEISPEFKVITNNTTDYNKDISYYTVKDNEGISHTVVCYASNLNGWYIAQSISDNQFLVHKSSYFPLILLIIALLLSLGSMLTYTFNRMINRPISRINKKILEISAGDFSKNASIESSDEIGAIGKGINILSQDVLELIESRVADEKQKKELEFRMLQSQINPHFLYNTLNSIKWMATIQNASGIPEMTTSLARLLRNIAKGTSELITIKEELDLLKNYITIQQYRYGGSITVNYNIMSEDLYECNIIKFTLQPIVENAIFHGIEPKSVEGIVDINIKKFDCNKIEIHVIDNGIGISEDKIEKLLSAKETTNKGSFNNIGISNVNERIKLTFGNQYGLNIKSKLNEYTNVIITIPY